MGCDGNRVRRALKSCSLNADAGAANNAATSSRGRSMVVEIMGSYSCIVMVVEICAIQSGVRA